MKKINYLIIILSLTLISCAIKKNTSESRIASEGFTAAYYSDKELVLFYFDIENKTTKDLVLLSPEKVYNQKYFYQLNIEETMTVNIFNGKECLDCHFVLMDVPDDEYTSLSEKYLITLKAKEKRRFRIYTRDSKIKRKKGDYKIRFTYNFNDKSYKLKKSKPNSNKILKSVSNLTYKVEAEILTETID